MGDLIDTSMGVATGRRACRIHGDEDGFWREADTSLQESIERAVPAARTSRTAAPEQDAGLPGLWATLSTVARSEHQILLDGKLDLSTGGHAFQATCRLQSTSADKPTVGP